MDMAKYVAVGVLAVIVLATVTYEGPPEEPTAAAEQAAPDEVVGSYGAAPPASPEEAAPIPVLEPAPVEPAPVTSEPAPSAPAPAAPEPAPSPAAEAPSEVEVVVAKGQTLYDVARDLLGDGKRWREIYEHNRERIPDPDRVRAGLKLVFPKDKVGKAVQATSLPASAPAPAQGGRSYEVAKGDTLYSIARRELGSGKRWEEIAKLNDVTSERLFAGMTLRLPE